MTGVLTAERVAPPAAGDTTTGRSGWRWFRRLLLAASAGVVAAALVWVPLPLVTLAPGPALDAAPLISYGGPVHTVRGRFLLTTVGLYSPSALGALQAWLDPNREVLSEADVIPTGVSEDEYMAAQRRQFQTSVQVAAVVGLGAAGYPARTTGGGAQVVGIVAGSPADGRLLTGDVITAVGDRPVHLAGDLDALLRSRSPGETVELAVRRAGVGMRLAVALAPVSGVGPAALGVALADVEPAFSLPFPVQVTRADVGGPSGGLMMALLIYDLATGRDLTAGRVVAGTGTIDTSGGVGPVDGVTQKVVAAEQAGARVFVVPAPDAAEARAAASGHRLEVIPVTSVSDAIGALGGEAR